MPLATGEHAGCSGTNLLRPPGTWHLFYAWRTSSPTFLRIQTASSPATIYARRSSSCSVGRMPTLWWITSQVRVHNQSSKRNGSTNFKADSAVVLTPFSSPGVLPPDNTTAVHWGFLRAFNSVADVVVSIMEEQYTLYPNYRLVCTGTLQPSTAFEWISADW